MVEPQPSKLAMPVRSRSPAPAIFDCCRGFPPGSIYSLCSIRRKVFPRSLRSRLPGIEPKVRQYLFLCSLLRKEGHPLSIYWFGSIRRQTQSTFDCCRGRPPDSIYSLCSIRRKVFPLAISTYFVAKLNQPSVAVPACRDRTKGSRDY